MSGKRRKRPKRTSRGGGQQRQKLNRRVQELYAAGDLEEEAERLEEWEGDAPSGTPGGSAPADVEVPEDARSGRVVALTSAACRVEPLETGSPGTPASAEPEIACTLPSRLAWDQRSAVAVGDRVLFAPHGDGHRVVRVEERRTVLSRPDPQNPRQERVIAANVDVVVVVAAVARPPFRPAFVDRMVVAVERGGAEILICANKVDLHLDADTQREVDSTLDAWTKLDLRVIRTSVPADQGLNELRTALAGRTVAFVGHSGVGKSSLVSALAPEVEVAVGKVGRDARGRHTTTRSRLYQLAGGKEKGGLDVIDTPGIRELGLWQMGVEELRSYFPDLDELAPACRFRDCTHSHEPRCAVRAEAEDGEIDPERYSRYLRILASLE